ncbi:protein kinase domain-containing protein [Ditylenchus destructor]|uniref:Protein kinase domain-containing protein n=1 Tax=Ditylenchus destructor TaxID=166010 RepID=A0AAD4MIT7_9BILA|nr:protein kinase domain-containing protein [Ditylenchus destructor]
MFVWKFRHFVSEHFGRRALALSEAKQRVPRKEGPKAGINQADAHRYDECPRFHSRYLRSFCTAINDSMEMSEAYGESRTRPRRSVKPIERCSTLFKSDKQIKKEKELRMTAEERNKKLTKTGTSPKQSFSFAGTKRVFRIVRILGTGTTSRCYEIEDISTKVRYAMKRVDREQRNIALREANIYENLYHENILRCVGLFENEQFVFLVLQMGENGSLLDMLRIRGRFNELETCYFLHQILSACDHIHSSEFVHHDLKLNNIFLNKDFRVKVGDFGISTKATEAITGLYGTPNYIAPEMFDETRPHTNKVDMWAIGIMAYAMLLGRPPFETDKLDKTYAKIKQNIVRFPKHVSAEARALVRALLSSDPAKRPSAAEAISMPFFDRELPQTLPKSCMTRPATFYEVESIVDKRVNKKGQVEYLIRWKGYDDASNSWMPASRISNADLVEEFEQNAEVTVEMRRRSTGSKEPKKQRAHRTSSIWN